MMIAPFCSPTFALRPRPTMNQWLSAKMSPTSRGANKNRPKKKAGK